MTNPFFSAVATRTGDAVGEGVAAEIRSMLDAQSVPGALSETDIDALARTVRMKAVQVRRLEGVAPARYNTMAALGGLAAGFLLVYTLTRPESSSRTTN